jgi:replication factor C subunit 3/5
MTLELNASDDRGIDVVRERIKSFCSTQQLMSKGLKLVILDECDSMTNAAQFALRRIVEKYTKNVRFCLICNYVSKIIPALQSRCTRFRFGPLDDASVLGKLNEVARAEQLNLQEGADKAIVSLSGGDMRKVLNILESCGLAYKDIPLTKIYEVTGRPSPADIKTIYTSLTTDDFSKAMKNIWNLCREKSLAIEDIIRDIHLEVMQTKLPDQMKMFLINRLSEIEYRLAQGSNERVQASSFIGAFVEVRTLAI